MCKRAARSWICCRTSKKACDLRNDFEPRHIAIASRHEYRAKEARKHYPFFAIDQAWLVFSYRSGALRCLFPVFLPEKLIDGLRRCGWIPKLHFACFGRGAFGLAVMSCKRGARVARHSMLPGACHSQLRVQREKGVSNMSKMTRRSFVGAAAASGVAAISASIALADEAKKDEAAQADAPAEDAG